MIKYMAVVNVSICYHFRILFVSPITPPYRTDYPPPPYRTDNPSDYPPNRRVIGAKVAKKGVLSTHPK